MTPETSSEPLEALLARIADATAPVTGAAFFRVVVRHLAEALSFREVFITECIGPQPTRVRMLCHWLDGDFAESIEYDLAGTPCERTIREGRPTFIGEALETLYPDWPGNQAYFGVPIFGPRGDEVVGHIAFFDDRPRPDIATVPVFRLLAARTGAELLRQRAEDELRASESRYRLLVENQTDLLLKLDARGRCMFASPSFSRAIGVPESGLQGMAVDAYVDVRDRAAFAAARTAAQMHPFRGQAEVRMLTASGTRWFAWMLSRLPAAAAAAAETVAAGRDVTDRRLAEERARQHLETVAHVARLASTGDMASALAHEVNQPLTAVLTYSQACIRLLRSGQATPAETIEWMERVALQAERAAEILRRLRLFVRKEEVQREALRPGDVVRAVVALMQPQAHASAVSLLTETPDDLPTVWGDGIQIQQVLVNLLRNAIEAIESAGSGPREVRVAAAVADDGFVELIVDDTGPGFDAAVQARLFEPFFTTKPDGMGIGLSVSRAIVEAHGGRMLAAARPEGGARFRVALPASHVTMRRN